MTQLELRRDHATAVDAVHAELDLERDFGTEFVERFSPFEVQSQARDKVEYLLRPDLGRRLPESAREKIRVECKKGTALQIAIGDGLSAAAVKAQVPGLLPLLAAEASAMGWTLGRPIVIRYCRVGVLNEIGELLAPEVVVLLIGERPGLATALSMSAYLAFRPRHGHTDADRNLISNIHSRGVDAASAARRIVGLAQTIRRARASGVSVKEVLPPGSDTSPRIGPS
jgi:ethanolamine ammonia-lyase small subunit